MNYNDIKTIDKCTIAARGGMTLLSQEEINRMMEVGQGGVHELFRKCCLAVLNHDASDDDAMAVLNRYPDFNVKLIPRERGIHLQFINAPAQAFVDGKMISGIRDSIFAVLRDIVFQSAQKEVSSFDLQQPFDITNYVFEILRRAEVHQYGLEPNLVVCWGGHSINRVEYQYTKDVGYQIGLRGGHICTGCGTGAMKGPMKGASVGHAKQRIDNGRYVGLTEPSIIAAEAPNPIVNNLVIMPDIEKRLEAFVRLGHGIIVFPGGVGTAEEILYLLGILLHPANADMELPVIFTGPADSADYFRRIDEFLVYTLGEEVRRLYRIIVDDPTEVARAMRKGIDAVADYRRARQDAFYYNWRLNIDRHFQETFEPTHEDRKSTRLN